jgi:hypothetical protein
MKILKAGTKVSTVIGGIEAIVVGVCITIDTVEYKIRYFAGGDERISWLYRFEIEITPTKQRAGFGNKTIDDDFNEVNLIEE